MDDKRPHGAAPGKDRDGGAAAGPKAKPVPPGREPPRVDALLPGDMAELAERIGTGKVRMEFWSLLTLAVLAGAFIAFGAMFSTTVVAGSGPVLPFGVVRLLAGVTFSLGLILVVIGGAELFTGNNLMVMAWCAGHIRAGEMLRAWTIVYIGNLVGSIGTAVLVFLAGHHEFGGGAVGATALAIADGKAALRFDRALFLGVLCNVLVCLAVWLSYSARRTTGKIAAVVPPITAFVAAGFEHSIANMYFLSEGLLIKGLAGPGFWDSIGRAPADYGALGLGAALLNLVPVTIGNVIGGGVLVGLVYWFVYLRKR